MHAVRRRLLHACTLPCESRAKAISHACMLLLLLLLIVIDRQLDYTRLAKGGSCRSICRGAVQIST